MNFRAWVFINKEILELKSEFEKEFSINLIRDYENDWEWICNDLNKDIEINISRQHNWETGEFLKPLRIHITLKNSELQIEDLIKKTQNVLKSDLFFGDISNRGISLDDYKATRIIKYQK